MFYFDTLPDFFHLPGVLFPPLSIPLLALISCCCYHHFFNSDCYYTAVFWNHPVQCTQHCSSVQCTLHRTVFCSAVHSEHLTLLLGIPDQQAGPFVVTLERLWWQKMVKLIASIENSTEERLEKGGSNGGTKFTSNFLLLSICAICPEYYL